MCFVLPEAQDDPPVSFEGDVLLMIALDVACDLRAPIVGVAVRRAAPVLGAPMPPAPHDLHSDARSREDDIWPNRAEPRHRDWVVDTEAKSPSVQERPHRDLRPSVPAPVGAHVCTAW